MLRTKLLHSRWKSISFPFSKLDTSSKRAGHSPEKKAAEVCQKATEKQGVEFEKEERKATRTEKEVDALEKELVKASPKSVLKRQGRAPTD